MSSVQWAVGTAFHLWKAGTGNGNIEKLQSFESKPPDGEFVKINVDASFISASSNATTGCLLREMETAALFRPLPVGLNLPQMPWSWKQML